MKLGETLKGTEGIYDDHMWELIHECIDDINSKTGFYIDTDLLWLFGEGSHSFGTTYHPVYEGGEWSIVLNKHMVGEEDNAIKNTICHELCHYIHNKEMLDEGILVWYDEDTLRYTRDYQRGRDSSHGTRWKEIAAEVTRTLQLNPPITTTNSFELHKNVGDYAQSQKKYQVTCKNCGATSYFQRATDFVRNPNRKGNTRDYYWYCGVCNKGGNFETTYNAREEIKNKRNKK